MAVTSGFVSTGACTPSATAALRGAPPELIPDSGGYPVIASGQSRPSSSTGEAAVRICPPARRFSSKTLRLADTARGHPVRCSAAAELAGNCPRALGRCLGRGARGRRSSPPWRSRPHVRLHVANRAELPQLS